MHIAYLNVFDHTWCQILIYFGTKNLIVSQHSATQNPYPDISSITHIRSEPDAIRSQDDQDGTGYNETGGSNGSKRSPPRGDEGNGHPQRPPKKGAWSISRRVGDRKLEDHRYFRDDTSKIHQRDTDSIGFGQTLDLGSNLYSCFTDLNFGRLCMLLFCLLTW